MLMQTNSYVVAKEKRTEHARLLNRFRQTLARLGCDQFEVHEQTGANWSSAESTGRFVQIMRFRDRKHQLSVQAAERTDPQAQALIKEFCELINFPYQQQQGLFAVGFYNSVLPVGILRAPALEQESAQPTVQEPQELAPQEPPALPPEPEAAPAEPQALTSSDQSINDETALEMEPLTEEKAPTGGGQEMQQERSLTDMDAEKHEDNGQSLSQEQQQPHSL